MKIGDEVYVHGYVDEIRKDVIIIRNGGGYFGTIEGEIVTCDKCIWSVCNYNKVDLDADTPQTDSEITRNSLRTDCNGCRFVGTYDTEFPCANCVRKNKDYYDADTPQTDCGWK